MYPVFSCDYKKQSDFTLLNNQPFALVGALLWSLVGTNMRSSATISGSWVRIDDLIGCLTQAPLNGYWIEGLLLVRRLKYIFTFCQRSF